MNFKRYRQGQEDAHIVVIERLNRLLQMLRAGTETALEDHYTAVVLPTRYGKSDVIRSTAIEAFRGQMIHAALVLSPSRFLRGQMVDREKFAAMIQRYEIEDAGALKYRALQNVAKDLYNPTANGEFLLSSTIHLINENLGAFERWVESVLHRFKRPVAVYIDEAHTGSERNQFGELGRRLARAGASINLFTATPIRSDGYRIPGFDFDEMETRQIQRVRVRDGHEPQYVTVDVYEGCERVLKLKPHHLTTFRQAWDEKPSPLCRISRVPFDVNLKEINVKATEEPDVTLLSELSPTAARRELTRILRNPTVVRKGVTELVTRLHDLRQVHHDIKGITFVGNDDDPVKRVNEHANLVRDLMKDIDPSLMGVIATANDENEGIKEIERFANGIGDVLIVKMMGTLGLDISALKVGLDLSSGRTLAAAIQRIMRIATPHGHCVVAQLIAPADCLYRALFEELIVKEGGEATEADLALVRSYTKLREESPERASFVVQGVVDADFDDSDGIHAPVAMRARVDEFCSIFKGVRQFMSDALIGQQLSDYGINIQPRRQSPMDIGEVIDDLRKEINGLAKEIIDRRFWAEHAKYDQEDWRDMAKEVWNRAKSMASVPLSVDFNDIEDIAVLNRLKVAFTKMRQEAA